MRPTPEFPRGHVSGRILDTTHITHSIIERLLIIPLPHQKGLVHNPLVCQPNVEKPQQADRVTSPISPSLPLTELPES